MTKCTTAVYVRQRVGEAPQEDVETLAMTTDRLMYRFWGGAFPQFHLLPEDERNVEDQASQWLFGSVEFAALRTQLRLKLQETPAITHKRRPAADYDALIGLVDKYLPYLVAVREHVLSRYAPTATAVSPGVIGTIFPTLFYGYGGIELRSDRFVGKEHRIQFTVHVECVLVFVLLGQLFALKAEAQVQEGLRLQSASFMEIAESSWAKSAQCFAQVSHIAEETRRGCVAGDPLVASIIRFFQNIFQYVVVLEGMIHTHRASARIMGLVLVDETPERLVRNASVCARHAFTIATQVVEASRRLPDTEFSQQLAWIAQTYHTRWKVIQYQYDQTAMQLDFSLELAIHLCDVILRERLANPPDCAPRHSPYFTRISQELQLAHSSQLNEVMNVKNTLRSLCHDRFGVTWVLGALPQELEVNLIDVPSLVTLFDDERTETFYTSAAYTMEVRAMASEIIGHIQRAVEHSTQESSSLANFSVTAVTETPKTHILIQDKASRSEADANVRTASSGTSLRIGASTNQEAEDDNGILWNRRNETTRSGTSQTISKNAQVESSWVTMSVGNRMLHFEKATNMPRPATANTANYRRNAVGMAIQEFSDGVRPPSTKKPRPSSSPSYLSSKGGKQRGAKEGVLTWVPNRISCALCERRFTRHNLPGVAVMKRIFDLRRKWGMVIHDSKKFNAASALYGKACVCLMCQDILTFEEERLMLPTYPAQEEYIDDVGIMILKAIKTSWTQQPLESTELLLDVAVNQRARQSSTNFGLAAQNATIANSIRTAHTREEYQPWWEVDLGNYHVVHSIKIWLRDDTPHPDSTNRFSGNFRHAINHEISKSKVFAGASTTNSMIPTFHPNLHLYPLYLSVSMKTGVDRDFEDIIASAVSYHCVPEKAVQPIVWITPPNCRGRFVRIQARNIAYLHIEKVHVFTAQERRPTYDIKQRQYNARMQLKRAAFRASVISKPIIRPDVTSGRIPDRAEISPTSDKAYKRDTEPVGGLFSTFGNPELAEKRRISRLYNKFRSLLDARAKYAVREKKSPVI